MISLTFDVFKFNREAKEVLITSISVQTSREDCKDITQVCDTLRFLYPQAVGVRVTIM